MIESLPEHPSIDCPSAGQGKAPGEMYELLGVHPETRGLIEVYRTAVRLAEVVSTRGGQVFLVGGAVRDEVLGQVPKDFDLEIHGLPADEVEVVVAEFGQPQSVGKAFGTLLLQTDHGKIDVALPRRDSKTGAGHRDFRIEVSPGLGITEAARRREFTIGAIYKELLSGRLYDPFGGIRDLDQKKLRLVDAATFADDPLRVLRGLRHAARFDLTVEPDTKLKMVGLVEQVGALAKERIREEWVKMLTEAKRPSVGIELAREIGLLERWHPELAKLWVTPQDPLHHPEGAVGRHTMMVVDEASSLARQQLFGWQHRQELMLAALTHDLGKPQTTRHDGDRISAIGHEAAGVKPAEVFLEQIGIPSAVIDRIGVLVAHHLRPVTLYRDRATIGDQALRRLARDIGPAQLRPLITLAEADHRGRGPFPMPDGSARQPDTGGYRTWWEEQIERLGLDQPPEPILWGRDVVEGRGERNWPPGKMVGEAVRLAQELALDGMTREQILGIIDRATAPADAVAELRQRLPTDP
ncbi:MAG: CCA tRNA nucleotidyltransferase [Patescibacteria group bacterium]